MIRLTEASFVASAPSMKECLPEGCSEVAFLGRSNVGKSSIINALTNRKNLAKKSATPGKTRLINFFDITYDNEGEKSQARFVDLPGFGYAKVSKSEKKLWEKNLTDFIEQRVSIRLFILLIDSRHPGLEIDEEVANYLERIVRPDQEVLRIFTKTDKLKQNELGKLHRDFPGSIAVSVLKKRGLEKANNAIYKSLFGEPNADL